MKIALVLCAEKSYLPGIQCMLKTLYKYNDISQVDKILFSNDIEKLDGFHVKRIPIQNYQGILYGEQKKSFFHKLEVFNLKGYDRVVFLDSDLLCMGDISLLFSERLSHKPFWAVRDLYSPHMPTIKGSHATINSGVMVINHPLLNRQTYQDLISIAERKLGYDKTDQGAINEFLYQHKIPIGYLPDEYNVLKILFWYDSKLYNSLRKNIRFLHFIMDKPWHGEDQRYNPLYLIWHDELHNNSTSRPRLPRRPRWESMPSS